MKIKLNKKMRIYHQGTTAEKPIVLWWSKITKQAKREWHWMLIPCSYIPWSRNHIMHQFQTEWKIGFSSPLILIFELCEWAIWWISPQMCLNITEVGIRRYQSKIEVDCGRFIQLTAKKINGLQLIIALEGSNWSECCPWLLMVKLIKWS